MINTKLRIQKLKDSATIPKYESEMASGLDLSACINEPICIKPFERILVPTGIAIELEKGFEAQVRARSGLSFKHGITVINGIGTIDQDYRGEILVPIVNLGENSFNIDPNMRIAQLVVCPIARASIDIIDDKTDSLQKTIRSSGGFGSSGIY